MRLDSGKIGMSWTMRVWVFWIGWRREIGQIPIVWEFFDWLLAPNTRFWDPHSVCISLALHTRLKCQFFLLVKSAQFDNLEYPIKTRDKRD